MSERIRIKDIALKAGVSPGTVDRVIHNRGNVSAKAKSKVLEALELLDYSPNILASALAYNKKWKIAALMPKEQKDPFWNLPKEGVQKALKVVKDYGISVDFYHFSENDFKDFERQGKKILLDEYHCIIISPIFTEQSVEFMNACEERDIPYIQINTYLARDSENMLGYIGQDSYHSGTLGAKLLAFGLSPGDSAMICHMEEMVYNAQHLIDKENGFKDYFNDHSDLDIDIVIGQFTNPYDKEGLIEFFKNHLEKRPKIKGIFVTTSRAFHAVNALHRLGRTDLKIVGFDLIDENLEFLYTEDIDFIINQNPHKQGYLAVINIFNYLIRKLKPNKLQHLPLDVIMKENVVYYTESQIEEVPIVL